MTNEVHAFQDKIGNTEIAIIYNKNGKIYIKGKKIYNVYTLSIPHEELFYYNAPKIGVQGRSSVQNK